MVDTRSLVYRFYAYRALVPEGWVYPVVNLFMLARGLSLSGIGLANAAFFVGTVLGEVPTGYVGDRLGRRNSLVVSALAVSATMLAFTVTTTLSGFVALFVAWGVAVTFRSGSTGAWLYDTLLERDASESFTRISGRGSSAFMASSALMSLVGGAMYAAEQDLPFLVSAVTTFLGAVWLFTLPEPGVTDEAAFGFGDAWEIARDRFPQRPLRTFLLLTAAVLAVPETLDVFLQPIARDVGVSATLLGPLYAGLMGWGSLVSYVVEDVRERLGFAGWFTLAPVLLVVPFGAAVAVPTVALPAFFAARTVKSVSYTLRGQFLNDRLPSLGRATVLSLASMGYALVFVAARAGGGYLADAVGSVPALTLLGVLALAIVLGVRAVEDPFGE